MTSLPRAILFDAGGTLVLQNPDLVGVRVGLTIDPGEAFEAHYRTMAEFAALKIQGSDATWDWWLERYFARLGHPEPAIAGRVIDGGFGLWNWPLPGVVDGVRSLRESGIRLAVVSNSDGSVERSLAEAGFDGLFEFVLDSAVVGVKKPDRAIFDLALDRLRLGSDEAWYVGDSAYHDLGGATGAGLAGAWLVDPLGLYPEVERRVATVAGLVEVVASPPGPHPAGA